MLSQQLFFALPSSAYSRFEIVEQFLKFVDCSDKTGFKIAQMITET